MKILIFISVSIIMIACVILIPNQDMNDSGEVDNITIGKYNNIINYQDISYNDPNLMSNWLSKSFNYEIYANYTNFGGLHTEYYYNCSGNYKICIRYDNDNTFQEAAIYQHSVMRKCIGFSFSEDKILNITRNMVKNLNINMDNYHYRIQREKKGEDICYYQVQVSPIININNNYTTEISDIGLKFKFYSDTGEFIYCSVSKLIEDFKNIHPYISLENAKDMAKNTTGILDNFTLSKIVVRNQHLCYLLEIDIGGIWDGNRHSVYIDIQNGEIEDWIIQEYHWG